jgi:hypothetical protein
MEMAVGAQAGAMMMMVMMMMMTAGSGKESDGRVQDTGTHPCRSILSSTLSALRL